MNDIDRAQWCENDEGLYRMMRASRLSKTAFVRANRAAIDECVNNVVNNRKPAHYLQYEAPKAGWRGFE